MKIMYADKDPERTHLHTEFLGGLGHQVFAFADTESALEVFTGDPSAFNLVISSLRVDSDTDGLDFLEGVKDVKPEARVVLIARKMEGLQKECTRIGVEKIIAETGDACAELKALVEKPQAELEAKPEAETKTKTKVKAKPKS